jgi:hypothetical protein
MLRQFACSGKNILRAGASVKPPRGAGEAVFAAYRRDFAFQRRKKRFFCFSTVEMDRNGDNLCP